LVVVASFAALATTRDEIVTPNLPPSTEGALYDRNDIWPAPSDGVQTPRPVASNDGSGYSTSTRPGPIGSGSEKLRFGGGSAIVSPRGGMISTPQMRAEREIDRLIRQLD
jgi:hypothetical protein